MAHPPYSTKAEGGLYSQGEKRLSGLRQGTTALASQVDLKEH